MKCPNCNTEMIIIERHNIQLDYCIFCHGIWFDNDELKYLSDALEGVEFSEPKAGKIHLTKSDKHKKRKCPRCNKTMDKVIIANKPPVVDMCPQHGYWFDENELSEYIKNNLVAKENGIISFLGEVVE